LYESTHSGTGLLWSFWLRSSVKLLSR
jgi:hypothetical protein